MQYVLMYDLGEYGAGSRILLRNNTLSRFDSDVFQSVLEKMAPHEKSYVSIYESNNKCRNIFYQ